MRVAFVITGLGIGGAEKLVVSLANKLFERGHEVAILYLKGRADVLPCDGVEVYPVEFESFSQFFSSAIKIRGILSRFRPDVVNSHLFHANMIVRFVRLLLPMRMLVTSAHNSNEEGPFRMTAYRLTNWLSDVLTNVSDEAVRVFEKQGAVKSGQMITVHNGIDVNQFYKRDASERLRIRNMLGVNESDILMVSVGRFCDAKDYPNLVNSIKLLASNSIKAWSLIVAGDGPLRASIEELSVDLGVADHIKFLGLRDDVPDLFSASDVFVLSSAWEGFPMVVGEAMASECFVIATDCGGVAEFLGDNGFLVEPRNPVALAEALNKSLALPDEMRLREARRGRSRVESLYSIDLAIDKWLKIYQGNVDNNPPSF